MPKLSSTEYEELRGFLGFYSERFFDMNSLAPDMRPAAVLEAMERRAPAKAIAGLRMAINDCLEMSSRWPPDRVRALDSELSQNGLVTLSLLRKRYSRDYARISKLGRIGSEVDYYLVKGILDGAALDLTDKDRQMLDRMITSYEKGILTARSKVTRAKAARAIHRKRWTSPAAQGDVIADRCAALSEDGMLARIDFPATLRRLRTKP